MASDGWAEMPRWLNSISRVLDKRVIKTGDCWIWDGYLTHGYGYISINKKKMRAHRAIYEYLVGPIPEGLELDHLCRNRACVNPNHLEPVTHAVNQRRGSYATKVICIKGHPLEGKNLSVTKSGGRSCKLCRRDAQRRYKGRKAA